MTSVTYPFFVGTPGADKKIPFKDAEFRYTTKSVYPLERAAGGELSMLLARGKTIEVLVLLVWFGLLWNDDEMSEQKALDLIDEFIDAGGNTTPLFTALYKALYESGVYGRPVEGTGAKKGTKRPTR